MTGHAVECRVNAEDPRNNFMPTPGRVTRWIPPQGGGVRVDSHVFGGYLIPPYYDSMIAKVLTHGSDRQDALHRMDRALRHLTIDGVSTNKEFLRGVIADEDFMAQRHHTRWVEQAFLPHWIEAMAAQDAQETMTP
jgi:acetyl-CoA carboxylase biotin carboxylase subunit